MVPSSARARKAHAAQPKASSQQSPAHPSQALVQEHRSPPRSELLSKPQPNPSLEKKVPVSTGPAAADSEQRPTETLRRTQQQTLWERTQKPGEVAGKPPPRSILSASSSSLESLLCHLRKRPRLRKVKAYKEEVTREGVGELPTPLHPCPPRLPSKPSCHPNEE